MSHWILNSLLLQLNCPEEGQVIKLMFIGKLCYILSG